MKLAASALFAFALLAGNTGCRLLHCGVPCGCDGFADDCGGCAECGGVSSGPVPIDGHYGCGFNRVGLNGCGCMGCGPLYRVFNWSRCHDCCDACGNWTGAPIVSNGPGMPPEEYIEEPASYAEPAPEELSDGRIVPGSMRVTTRRAEEAPQQIAAEPRTMARRAKSWSPQRRPKRITSTPPRSR
jgi:hypothetical protein